ncbi:MAG: hypothetical protein BWY03_00058 [Parcubacteria group bacterium ADurb.Bin159]|jgi:hypothetical protein|nr:MAG: hypothetical protein BWY03_00058 [Parcubacteria group bacterium ADurb.Bin159]
MIEDYSFGQIKIDGKIYKEDVEIDGKGEIRSWWRKESHFIDENDIENAFKENPQAIIIGTGAWGVAKVSPEIKNKAKEKQINLIVDKTGKAIKKYNKLQEEGKRITGFFHLTC